MIHRMNSNTGLMEEAKPAVLQVGQIVWLNGYGQSKHYHNRKAVKEISEGSNGPKYLLVNLDKPEKSWSDGWEIRHDSEIFGIGLYYTDGDFADLGEIEEAYQKALVAEKQRQEASKAKAEERERLIAIGKKILADYIPPAKAVIVAELQEDRSDPMTDYFASHTVRTLILAFSKHKRDLFPEMRKACLNCDIPGVRALYDAPADWEHREKYSMGSGFYIGEHSYSGWHIRKNSWIGDDIYIAAAKDFYAGVKMKPISGVKVELVRYSDKAIAVFGDTKPLCVELRELGGKFNPHLKRNGEKVPGWVFPVTKQEKVERFINQR